MRQGDGVDPKQTHAIKVICRVLSNVMDLGTSYHKLGMQDFAPLQWHGRS
jgi:hypothetical protein